MGNGVTGPRGPSGVPVQVTGLEDGFITVGPKEKTLRQVADRLGISVQDLKEANPRVVNPNQLVPGQVLEYPQDLLVGEGETTLKQVAQRLGIDEQSLRKANPKMKEPLTAGHAIRLPKDFKKYDSQPKREVKGDFKTVVEGEKTLGEMAKRLGVGKKDLEDANPGIDPNNLKQGQRIRMPKKEEKLRDKIEKRVGGDKDGISIKLPGGGVEIKLPIGKQPTPGIDDEKDKAREGIRDGQKRPEELTPKDDRDLKPDEIKKGKQEKTEESKKKYDTVEARDQRIKDAAEIMSKRLNLPKP